MMQTHTISCNKEVLMPCCLNNKVRSMSSNKVEIYRVIEHMSDINILLPLIY